MPEHMSTRPTLEKLVIDAKSGRPCMEPSGGGLIGNLTWVEVAKLIETQSTTLAECGEDVKFLTITDRGISFRVGPKEIPTRELLGLSRGPRR